MRILGIDPGLRFTGYACVERIPNAEPTLVEAGVVRLRTGTSVSARLLELERDLGEIIERVHPERACVEKLFAHYRRPMTAVAMGHARGVVLLTIRKAGVELSELAATEVKKSLTGNGHASKTQMQASVRAQLGLLETPRPPDVADAIAIALCEARRAEAAVELTGRVTSL